MEKKKIVLIGNYPPDGQESMERFAQMLQKGFAEKNYPSDIWRPKVLVGKLAVTTTSGYGKWLGYIDKWIVFPFIIRWRLKFHRFKISETQFHICDHSNAPYIKYFPRHQSSVTCHDVLAIRGALGYPNTYCTSSRFGVILQKWILKNLLRTTKIAFVSNFTHLQLQELDTNRNEIQKKWTVIHNGFNDVFTPLELTEAKKILNVEGLDPDQSYILHVGSGLERKNRKLLLDMVARLGNIWQGKVYYAGKPVDTDLSIHISALGLSDRVISIVKPNHKLLQALYTVCEAFIFPSLSEGFGWPAIEAQACGAPVIASKFDPMPEINGKGALYCDPQNPDEFASAFLSLNKGKKRIQIIKEGFKNAERFEPTLMIDEYLQFFEQQ